MAKAPSILSWMSDSDASSAPSTFEERCIGDYVFGKPLGGGCCATVRLATHRPTGTEVVVKTLARRCFPNSNRERRCLKEMNHPNISQLMEILVSPDRRRVHLVLEHVRGGDLQDHLRTHGRLSEGRARKVFRQVVSALQYCHQRGFAHRDVKPHNILLEPDMTAKLADFGLSRHVCPDQKVSTYCGTPYYMAPEVMRFQPYEPTKADVWSLGASLHVALTGRPPFPGRDFRQVRARVLAGLYAPPRFLSGPGRSFLRRLLTLDPAQRPSLEEAMRLPWLNVGHRRPLQPYREPPWTPRPRLDPLVLEQMRGLGFAEEAVRDSVAQWRFDRAMGTYRLLRLRAERMPAAGRMPGRTVQVRPYRPPDSGAASPPPRLEPLAPPAPRQGGRDFVTKAPAPPAAAPARPPQEGSPAAPAEAHTPGRPGRARRACQTFLRLLCCGFPGPKLPRRKGDHH